jgi:hypothetical protein
MHCSRYGIPATSSWPGRSFLFCAVNAAASGSLVIRREGDPVEGISPAAMAALRMMCIDDWDRPAGTVRHQRTVEGWNLQKHSKRRKTSSSVQHNPALTTCAS